MATASTPHAPAVPTASGAMLRCALGIVFLWFGGLKLVPGMSPAEPLICGAVGWLVDPEPFTRVLAVWECVIGVGLLVPRLVAVTLPVLAVHLAGTFLPLIACPGDVWTRFPFALTLEGQYIAKNLVLIGAAVAVARDHGRWGPPARRSPGGEIR